MNPMMGDANSNVVAMAVAIIILTKPATSSYDVLLRRNESGGHVVGCKK